MCEFLVFLRILILMMSVATCHDGFFLCLCWQRSTISDLINYYSSLFVKNIYEASHFVAILFSVENFELILKLKCYFYARGRRRQMTFVTLNGKLAFKHCSLPLSGL